jgi:hypothetical protein
LPVDLSFGFRHSRTPVWVIKNGRMVDLTRGKRRKGRKPCAR